MNQNGETPIEENERSNGETPIDGIQNIKQLNEKYFYLFGRLYDQKECLPKKVYDYQAERIFEEYKIEYALLKARIAPKQQTELFRMQEDNGHKVPWHFLFFRNRAAKEIEEKAQLWHGTHFDRVEWDIKTNPDKWQEKQEGAEKGENESEKAQKSVKSTKSG